MDWNPNTPDVVGLEFAPKSGDPLPAYRIDAAFRTAIQRLKSTTSETIGSVAATMSIDPGSDLVAMAEVLIADDAVSPPVTTTVFRPSAVLMASGDPFAGDFRTQNFATRIGGTSDADLLAVVQRSNPTSDDYVGVNIVAPGFLEYSYLATQYDTDGILDGERITDVRVIVTGFGTGMFSGEGRGVGLPIAADDYLGPSTPNAPQSIDPPTGPGAVSIIGIAGFPSDPITLSPANTADLPSVQFASGVPLVSTLGEMVPTDNLTAQPGSRPWRTADIDALDASTGDRAITVRITPGNGAGRVLLITSIYIEVDHVPENRLAVDMIRSGGPVGVVPVTWTPHAPDGTAEFDKTSGQDLLIVLRRVYFGMFNGYAPPGAFGSMLPTRNPGDYSWSVPYIDAFLDTGAPAGLEQYPSAALNANGTVALIGDGRSDRITGMDLRVYPSGFQSVDAQPWDTILPMAVGSGTIQQEITTAAATSYDGIQVPVRYSGDAEHNDLVIDLKRRSDNALMGTVTISKAAADAQAADPSGGWRFLRAPFAAPVALAASTQYYFDFTSGATGIWEVPALGPNPTIGNLSFNNTATYDGNTDVATFPGYSSDLQGYSDIAASVYMNPVTPTGLTATAGSFPLIGVPTAPEGDPAAITAVGRITLAWTGLVDTANTIEVQRADDSFFGDYRTIYMLPGTYTSVIDWEARIGVRSYYRIRAVNPVLGLSSPWSNVANATRESFGCGYTFATNTTPFLFCGYSDIYSGATADRTYSFPEAAERVFRTIYERPFQVGFRPPQQRGVQFTRTLLVRYGNEPIIAGDIEFPLAVIARDPDLPYVCVLDESGNRFFAAVDVSSSTTRRPGERVYIDVTVTETMADPAPVVISP